MFLAHVGSEMLVPFLALPVPPIFAPDPHPRMDLNFRSTLVFCCLTKRGFYVSQHCENPMLCDEKSSLCQSNTAENLCCVTRRASSLRKKLNHAPLPETLIVIEFSPTTELRAFGNFLAQGASAALVLLWSSCASHMMAFARGVHILVEKALWQHRQAGDLDPPPSDKDAFAFLAACLYLEKPHVKEAGIQR